MDTIYAIQINKLSFGALKVLDVKIGMTTNIKNTLMGYRRSSAEAELLNLWEANPSQRLRVCETGVHLVAEKYAYQRKREKFIFLQNNYDDFAKNIGFLLKEISPGGVNPDGACIYTGKKPKSFKFDNIRYDVDSWTNLLVSLCEEIYKRKGEDFLNVLGNSSFRGKKLPYFSRDKRDLTNCGKKIRGANIYVETGFSASDIIKFCKKILDFFGYNTDLSILIKKTT